MKKSGIYSITCVPTGKRYIGSSISINERWWHHRSMLKHGRHYNPYLQRAWNKYGTDAFTFDIIEIVDKANILERETYWIAFFRSCEKEYGFNDKDIANASKLTEEAIARMAAKKRGSKHTPETKAKMSASRRGHAVSPETRAKLSAAHRGRKLSPERVAQMAEAARGKSPSTETRLKLALANGKTYEVIDPQGNTFIVKTLSIFCRERGIDPRRLSAVASGQNRSWRGWRCRRIEVSG